MIIRIDGKTVVVERSWNGFGRCTCTIGCICVRLRCILCAALRLPGSRRFVPDSLLEGDGFEPSIVAREQVYIAEVNWGYRRGAKKFCGYRWVQRAPDRPRQAE
jgi:hypothetical protein